MKVIVMCVLLNVIFVFNCFATDANQNGIEDSYEDGLVQKFMPCVQLDNDDDGVSPKPVEIIGADQKNNVYTLFRTFPLNQFAGVYKQSDFPYWGAQVGVEDLTTYWENMPVVTTQLPGDDQAYDYWHTPFWNFGSASDNTDGNWRSYYASVKDNYNEKTYVHMWELSGYVCIRYWFFYPYNDWCNNHEGDWEAVTVIVDSQNPATASLVRAEFMFHLYYWSTDDFSKCFLIDDTHVVVFSGGGGNQTVFGVAAQGPSGHGCYPMPGDWEDVGAYIQFSSRPDEDVESSGQGRFIHYSEFDYQILKDINLYDFEGADINMAWLGSHLSFGYYKVPSPGDWYQDNVGNRAPLSPAHNPVWGKVMEAAAASLYDYWYTESLPYATAIQSGWGLHVPGHYTNLQDALDEAGDGMTVFVDEDITITTDIEIPDDVILAIDPNVTIHMADGTRINVYGELDIQDGVTFTKIMGGSYWGGIILRSDALIDVHGDITIEECRCAISIYDAIGYMNVNNGANTITIQNCEICGISVNSGSPFISNINFINAGAQYGSISCAGGSASIPPIQSCTSQGGKHALYVGYNGSAAVDWYDIKNTHTSYPVNSPYPSSVSLNGTNNIIKAAGVTRAVNNGPSGFIDARNNWWGVYPPTSSLFPFPDPAYIDYSNAKTSLIPSDQVGIYKTIVDMKSFEIAEKMEFDGNISDALDIYEYCLKNETNPWKKKLIITSMLRATTNGGKRYDSLREIVNNELKTADSYYEATLDAILCEMLIAEEKYEDAIVSLYEKADKYKGTAMEVEFLARISLVYSDKLRDNRKALEVADLASSINPGQDVLWSVYESAGQKYNSWECSNIYKNEMSLERKPREQRESDVKQSNVALSPNPFNPTTTISYSLVQEGMVSLSVYSITGQQVTKLVDGWMSAGNHSVVFDGVGLASGVYFYRFESPGFFDTGKMLLVR